MTFEQALKAMKDGKAVTVGDYAGYFQYSGSSIWRYSSETKGLSQERLMPNEYILSDKWEIVENIVPLSIPMECVFELDDIKTDNEHFWIVTELPYKPEYIKQITQLRVTFTPVIRKDDNA